MTTGIFDIALTQALLADLRRANTEAAKKERFLQYLTSLFAGDAAAQGLVSSMSLGAERTIANIQRGGRAARGRADTQTDTVIIEWERDLTRTGEHAKEQLEEYLQGNWSSGQSYRFILIATDGIRWRCYAPDWSRLTDRAFSLSSNFQLRETRRFDLTAERAGDFPFFLDEVLFSSRQRLATLENIQADFGDTSITFINCITTLQRAAIAIEEQSELRVAYEQWRRFLSIAYGRFDGSADMFLVHTYLSIFAKMIAYAVVARDVLEDEDTIRGILSGEVFERMNVDRFVEDDFFHWVHRPEFFAQLRPVFREISRQLAAYDFSVVQEDILKGVYQELIDLDTRHSLGEYYTPDWLCERVVASLPIHGSSRVLDPACGSGSFLRAVLAHKRAYHPDLDAAALATQVVGIDIHPLSVQIAKTTVLLALGSLVSQCERPVALHVYLANSLTVPQETADLFENTFVVTVDNAQYTLDIRGFTSPDQFDRIISFCDDLVISHADSVNRNQFSRLIQNYLPEAASDELSPQLFDVYCAMKRAADEGRDTIWKFILQNSYKPIFLGGRFDFIVGNPPWLTYAGVSNAEYQSLLLRLSDSYRVTPGRRANMPHLEIAAIFLAHASNYFLIDGGIIAFVMPRSFMSADQHENTRAGQITGFQLTEVWDLDGVSPLFRVPSCVLIGRKIPRAASFSPVPATGIRGLSLEGRLPRSHMHLNEAATRITEHPRTWFYSRLQETRGVTRSALTPQRIVGLSGANAYVERFTQGATIVPRNFFFVQNEDTNWVGDMTSRVVALRTSDESERDAKAPWKGKVIRRRAEGALLFRTAISRNVVPFGMIDPPLVLLPLMDRAAADGSRSFEVLDSEGLLAEGFSYASTWFREAERLWEANRTEKNTERETTLAQYLDWQAKLSSQNPNDRFLVLYTSSSTDASACAIDRSLSDYPFVADHKTYVCSCRSLEEAQYVACYLNSNWANEKIKDFQSRGLFGPRDIHKTILKLPFPRYVRSNDTHRALAEMGSECSGKVAAAITRLQFNDTSPRALGRLRTRLRDELAQELNAIDLMVSELAVGRSEAAQQTVSRRRRQSSSTGRLL